jgi:hypothetical protein
MRLEIILIPPTNLRIPPVLPCNQLAFLARKSSYSGPNVALNSSHPSRIDGATFDLSIPAVAIGEQHVSEQTLPRAKRRDRHQYPQLTEINVIKAVSGLPTPNALVPKRLR